MTIKQAVRQRILDYCAQQQLTLNGLSTRCGITQSTLQNIVSGRNHSVTLSTIKKSATVLTSPSWTFSPANFSKTWSRS